MSKIYCDGSGWNGQEAKYIVVDEHSNVLDKLVYTTSKTNNEMEYEAIISALFLAKDGDEIYSDSQLVINQLTKNWKINHDHLRKLNDIAKQALLALDHVQLIWIPRAQNRAGWLLE